MGVNGHWYVELEKQGWWKGVSHEWSNRYILSGSQPSASDAMSVIGALKDIENLVMPPVNAGLGVGFVAGKAYPSGKGTYFAEVQYNESGALATSTGYEGPGVGGYTSLVYGVPLECCLMVKTPINGLNSRGKPVQLSKFFRGIGLQTDTAGAGDGLISTEDLAYVATKTAPWSTGMGANGWVVIAGNGNQSSGPPKADMYLSNHQVPRGRKKKASSSGLLGDLEGLLGNVATSAAGNVLADAGEALLGAL